LLVSILVISSFITTSAQAFECLTYQSIQTQLLRQYGEQPLFRGFADAKSEKGSNEIYELWGNPENGSWSLIVQKLLVYQSHGKEMNKSCTLIIASGSEFSPTSSFPTKDSSDRITKPGHSAVLSETRQYNGQCIPHSRFVRELDKRFNESSVLLAISPAGSIIEIFVSPDSWTMVSASAGSVTHPVTGAPMTNPVTGQEIYQLCSMPIYSGKSWGLFEAVTGAI
jgi:hypothetical protein